MPAVDTYIEQLPRMINQAIVARSGEVGNWYQEHNELWKLIIQDLEGPRQPQEGFRGEDRSWTMIDFNPWEVFLEFNLNHKSLVELETISLGEVQNCKWEDREENTRRMMDYLEYKKSQRKQEKENE
jgi:hypothetical protein